MTPLSGEKSTQQWPPFRGNNTNDPPSGEKSTQKWPPFRGKKSTQKITPFQWKNHRNDPLSGGKSQKLPPLRGNNRNDPLLGENCNMPTPSLNKDWKSSHLSAAGRGSGRAGNPVFCASKLWSKSRIRSLHVFRIDPFTACVQDWSVHCMCSGLIRLLHVFRIDLFTACVQDWSVHCMCSGLISSLHVFRLIRLLHVFRMDLFTACVQDGSVHCMCSGWICSLHVFRMDPFTACVQDWSVHCMCSGFLSSSKFLNSDSNTYKFQRNTILGDKTHANFQGNPLYSSYKMTLEQRWLKGEKDETWGGELTSFWLSYVVLEPVFGEEYWLEKWDYPPKFECCVLY